jgi:hypothetical protein
MSEEAEGRAVPPTLTVAEHMHNVCVIASGLIIAPQNPVGTVGDDAMAIYHKVIDAYVADPEMPQSLAYVAPLPADSKGAKGAKGAANEEKEVWRGVLEDLERARREAIERMGEEKG